MPDELAVEVVQEPEVDGLEPFVEERTALVAAHAHQAPRTFVLRDLPQRVLVVRLQRHEAHALALEDYVKRQVPPSAYARRIRRATTILCTSSGPS